MKLDDVEQAMLAGEMAPVRQLGRACASPAER
jgi:hypothetical protein